MALPAPLHKMQFNEYRRLEFQCVRVSHVKHGFGCTGAASGNIRLRASRSLASVLCAIVLVRCVGPSSDHNNNNNDDDDDADDDADDDTCSYKWKLSPLPI